MNKIIFTFSLLLLFCQCNTHKLRDSNFKVKVTIIEKLSPDKFKNLNIKGNFYSANIELSNNTDSIFSFWIMNCSWQDNFTFNTDSIGFFSWGCDKNFQVLKQLVPHQKLIYKVIIHVLYPSNVRNKTDMKLGFIWIKQEEYGIFKYIDYQALCNNKIRDKKDILWSDPFKINK